MRLIGCYGFGRDPWRLVEIAFYDLEQPLDFADFVSANGQPVALHDLHVLDGSGTRVLHGGVAAGTGDVPLLIGDIRGVLLCPVAGRCTAEDAVRRALPRRDHTQARTGCASSSSIRRETILATA